MIAAGSEEPPAASSARSMGSSCLKRNLKTPPECPHEGRARREGGFSMGEWLGCLGRGEPGFFWPALLLKVSSSDFSQGCPGFSAELPCPAWPERIRGLATGGHSSVKAQSARSILSIDLLMGLAAGRAFLLSPTLYLTLWEQGEHLPGSSRPSSASSSSLPRSWERRGSPTSAFLQFGIRIWKIQQPLRAQQKG